MALDSRHTEMKLDLYSKCVSQLRIKIVFCRSLSVGICYSSLFLNVCKDLEYYVSGSRINYNRFEFIGK